MTTRREPTESGQSEDWVFVTHDDNYDERHPQYNKVNESPAQLAKACAPTSISHSSNMSTDQDIDCLGLCRKTVSNGSNETTSTDTAMMGPAVGSNTGNEAMAADPATDILTGCPLTLWSLSRCQREISQRYTYDISRWVEGTGFSLYARGEDVESSMRASIGGSITSTTSIPSLDLDLAQPVQSLTHDFCEMGAWARG